jgi:hypothetical protein
MPLPQNRRDASRVFSTAGCIACVSPAGANVVVEKVERIGGNPGCEASVRPSRKNEEASSVETRDL